MEANSFLDFYDVHEEFLVAADPATGRPYLARAEKDGCPLLIKFWPRSIDMDDEDLEDIWLHELRQLHRLKGYPGVGDYVSSIVDSGRDDKGFYLVLDASGRVPLSCITKSAGALSLRTHWLKRLRNPTTRILFWNNVVRIVKAIELLHAQGLLHRHLDSNSILSSGDINSEAIDFQLTGFEWSVRVHTMSSAPARGEVLSLGGSFCSFATDWSDLGFLLVDLLGIDVSVLENPARPVDVIVEKTGLTLSETHLIKALIGWAPIKANTPQEIMSSKLIESSIEKIIEALTAVSSHRASPCRLAINLKYDAHAKGSLHSLKSAVQIKYKEKYDVTLSDSDHEEIKKFVVQDLSDSPVAILSQNHSGNEEQLLIQGKELIYRLDRFQLGHDEPVFTWDFAFCQKAYISLPGWLNGSSKTLELNSSNIEVHSVAEARQLYRSTPNDLQGRSWEEVINRLDEDDSTFTPAQLAFMEGLAACHLTEVSYARAEIYPVDILESSLIDSGEWRITVTSCKNEDSEALSKSLVLDAPAVRLEKVLSRNDGDIETLNWSLVSSSLLAKEDNGEVILTYQDCSADEDGQLTYVFTSTQAIPYYKQYFIAPNSLQASFRQLSRRARALDTLGTHVELIESISNPQKSAYKTQDSVIEDSSFKMLDGSKQDALQNILKIMPLFLVQGPPGVGKTHLVTTLVKQIFEKEPDSRVLLSAQSHATVQHLYHEIEKTELSSSKSDTLIIRCSKQDNDDDSALSDADAKAKDFLEKLISSKLFENSTSHRLKTRILEMSQGHRSNRYTLVNQLLRSANMVFSTTNSEQIERMIKDRAQFDWSIMEETGKATGVELLSPLLLSHRRLMIGDHKQLPPYRSTEMKNILLDPSRLKAVLQESEQVQNPKVKGETCKSLLENGEFDESRLIEIGSNASKNLMLFESLVTNEQRESDAYEKVFGSIANRTPVGSMLSVQHRMHPYIADLVSEVFYNKKLTTHPERESFFLAADTCKPFFFSSPEHLKQAAPIVWIDMPDLQATKGMKKGDDLPRWQNSLECEAVVKILKRIRRSNEAAKLPTLAVLSPYAEQVKRIERAIIKKDLRSRFLSNLDLFAKPDDHSSFCSTVDAFQGGEADAVIISLVRNNDKGTLRSALGFLVDERRMNVLLSRCRHQLILIGSYEFIKSWAEKLSGRIEPKNQDGDFLVRLLNTLEEYKASNKMTIIPWHELQDS